MRARWAVAAAMAVASTSMGAVLAVPLPAAADGSATAAVTCTGIPVVGTIHSSLTVNATDNVDPVAPGGTVIDTINLPSPVGSNVPVTATISQIQFKINVPTGVTVSAVGFTSSSFSGHSWAVSSGVLTITLTGSVAVGGTNPAPTVPTISVTTTVAGPPRTVTWLVPALITVKATSGFGDINANCTPDTPSQVLITTTVADVNHPPVATNQAKSVPYQTATPITLAGTDPDSDPLTFALGSVAPGHGLLTGTPPSLTYTPGAGYSGPDSFTFTVSDGKLSSIGTVTITVLTPVNHPPVATNQVKSIPFQTGTPITLAGTDPDGNPLSYSFGTVAPSHGVLSGTPPNVTYTPANGYLGADSFTFVASDGQLTGTGTVSITVVATTPGPPIMGPPVAREGEVGLSWTPPVSNGGSPITGWIVMPRIGGIDQTPIAVPGIDTTSTLVTGLANGVARTFVVAATNALGTGANSAATPAVTPQWWLPWSTGTRAVTDVFTWFTGQAPTSTELTTWLSTLDGGTARLGDLMAQLRVGPDATANVDPTTRLYTAYFVRIPDRGGLVFWLGRKRGDMKLTDISNQFASSSEFVHRYGTLSNQDFVKQLYLNVQGRPGETAGVVYWTNQLDTHLMTRGRVMIGFSESSEYKGAQVKNLNAEIVWIFLLGRSPTGPQRDAFVTDLGTTSLPDEIRTLILTSVLLPPRVS